ncbi:MAG: hypothetical protein SFX73_14725 [Kofleriaceae bacterium]|nr:hypothetical protein [Kofleriaceae bacterium]
MRTTRIPLATSVGVAILLTSSLAAADVAGTYDVKFEEVSNNCTSPLRYPHGRLTVKVKSSTVTVDVERTPSMQGSVTKAGKVSAKSKSGSTPVGGMNGVFSVAGKITPEGMLSLVMIGEYTDAANGNRALCTQSWNVAGSKVDEPAAKPKKSATEAMFDLPSMLLQ